MNTAAHELVDDLVSRGVLLSARQNKLHIQAPKGLLTPELRSELIASKSAILALLQTRKKPEEVLQLAIAGLPVTVIEILNSPLFDNDDLGLIASGELTASELRYYISAWLDYGRCIPFPLP